MTAPKSSDLRFGVPLYTLTEASRYLVASRDLDDVGGRIRATPYRPAYGHNLRCISKKPLGASQLYR